MNHLFLLTYEGRYCLCPKNEGATRVLDMGTGTGMWAIDYGTVIHPAAVLPWAHDTTDRTPADANPGTEVIGVDLSPIQPG